MSVSRCVIVTVTKRTEWHCCLFFNVSHKYEAKVSSYRMLWISLGMMKVQTLKKSPSDLDSLPVTAPRVTRKFRTLHLVFFCFALGFFLHKVRQRFVWVAGVSWGRAEWQVSLSLRNVLISQCTANVTLCTTETCNGIISRTPEFYVIMVPVSVVHSLSSGSTDFFKGAKKSRVFLCFFCRTYFFPPMFFYNDLYN